MPGKAMYWKHEKCGFPLAAFLFFRYNTAIIIVNCEGDKECRNYGIGSPPLIGMKRSPLEMDGWGQCFSVEQ